MASQARAIPGTFALFVAILLNFHFGQSAAAAITFTGSVPTDFPDSDPTVTVYSDGGTPDVGVPPGWPFPFPGWDIAEVRLSYQNDTLYVGVDTFGIAGDADGDGNPSVTSPELNIRGGTDLPDYAGSEELAMLLDLDQNGIYDLIVGIPHSNDRTGFLVASTTGNPSGILGSPFNLHLGSELGLHLGVISASPGSGNPDIEFSITNFSLIPTSLGISNPDPTVFDFLFYHGSFQDDGVGEDFFLGTAIIPEPDTGLYLLFGIALLAFVSRRGRIQSLRRRSGQAPVFPG